MEIQLYGFPDPLMNVVMRLSDFFTEDATCNITSFSRRLFSTSQNKRQRLTCWDRFSHGDTTGAARCSAAAVQCSSLQEEAGPSLGRSSLSHFKLEQNADQLMIHCLAYKKKRSFFSACSSVLTHLTFGLAAKQKTGVTRV